MKVFIAAAVFAILAAFVASFVLSAAVTQEWCSAEAARLHAAFGQLDV